jgi:hypothetical protein
MKLLFISDLKILNLIILFKKMSGDTIGMMEGAFFVSKGVILDWMNELLDVSKFY